MKFRDELNPKLWTKDNELKQEVAEKLEEITQAFIEYLDIPLDAIEDVIITGSSANYNYTPQSDLDLHLRVDYDKVHKDCPIVEGYLWSMKAAFNKDHDISIYGIPVEVYAENVDTPAVSNGVYSLANDKWIKFPEKIPPTDNDLAVQAKFNELKEASERIEDSEIAEELLDKIYEMRKAGLADVGEFSTENMAFKMLRNEGVLERLREMKKQKIDKQLSLESYNQPIVNESWNTYSVQYQIIDRNDRISTKTKEFKTEKALQNWIAKQEDNPNFYGILATSYPDEIKLKENNEDDEDVSEEMHKERYVTYFETQEGRQKYTIYHVYTDSTDDSYNELCDKRDNQLGMYNSYKELKDALKERAEKIATKQGWTVKSIENLGEDDEYYKERNKLESMKENIYDSDRYYDADVQNLRKRLTSWGLTYGDPAAPTERIVDKLIKDFPELQKHRQEIIDKVDEHKKKHYADYDDVAFEILFKNESIKEGFKKGDKVQLKRKNNKIGIVKSIFNGDKDKNDKDIKYLDVEFEDGTKEGRPASDFRKVNESIKEEAQEKIYNPTEFYIVQVFDTRDSKWIEYYRSKDNQDAIEAYKDLKEMIKEGFMKYKFFKYPLLSAPGSMMHNTLDESIKESLQNEYKQAFDLLIEGENIVGTLDTDFGKQFVKDVGNLYKLKSYKLKLSVAKEMLKDIQGYLVDEQYDDYNAKINKFMNNSKNESIIERFNKCYEEYITNNQLTLESLINVNKKLKEVMEERPQ